MFTNKTVKHVAGSRPRVGRPAMWRVSSGVFVPSVLRRSPNLIGFILERFIKRTVVLLLNDCCLCRTDRLQQRLVVVLVYSV